jgi:hypothetical protein
MESVGHDVSIGEEVGWDAAHKVDDVGGRGMEGGGEGGESGSGCGCRGSGRSLGRRRCHGLRLGLGPRGRNRIAAGM